MILHVLDAMTLQSVINLQAFFVQANVIHQSFASLHLLEEMGTLNYVEIIAFDFVDSFQVPLQRILAFKGLKAKTYISDHCWLTISM